MRTIEEGRKGGGGWGGRGGDFAGGGEVLVIEGRESGEEGAFTFLKGLWGEAILFILVWLRLVR